MLLACWTKNYINMQFVSIQSIVEVLKRAVSHLPAIMSDLSRKADQGHNVCSKSMPRTISMQGGTLTAIIAAEKFTVLTEEL